MTVFFIVAALLVLAAVLFIVPPLLRREAAEQVSTDRRALNISVYQDQMKELERDLENDVITREQYAQSRDELEQRMLDDVSGLAENVPAPPEALGRGTVLSAVFVAALIPILAAGVYMQLGAPAALDPSLQQRDGMPMVASPDGSEVHDQILEMVERLEQRLAANPDDAEGWAMLGRSYRWLERFDRALIALERAVNLEDRNAQLLVDYADTLAMAGGNSLEGRPMELIERALGLEPDNEMALWLAGTAEYERANFQQALVHWERLYRLVPPGSDAARAMENNIAEVQSLISGDAPPPALARRDERTDSGTAPAAAGSNGRVQGTISIDESLSASIKPNDTVFVFARATEGPRLPLAVMRAQAGDLPMEYVLDDSMAMDPSMSLSQFSEVVVVARVSRSGSAMVQSGDLQGTSAVVRTGDSGPVKILIDEVVP